MTALSLLHVLSGLAAVVAGWAIVGLRKGDPRHRRLGWAYVGCMLVSLAAILAQGLRKPAPFHGYAALVAGGLVAAVLVPRARASLRAWRSWHAALMSFSMLAATVAIGGVVGGVILGVGRGPVYYRMFNVVVAVGTAAGLWIIDTRPVIWGRTAGPADARARLWFSGLVAAASLALVLAQAP
jgi:uncharacterized membrane protein